MKNNSKTKSLIMVAIIAIMLTISTIANAAGGNYSVGMKLTSDSRLNAGDTVTISINLASINAGNGIDTFEADLSYDTSVFEALTESDFQASNNWKPSYAAQTNRVTFQKNTKVTAAETVATIKLKVKSSISVDSTTIKLSNIIASGGKVSDGGTGDITVNNASVTIKKSQDATSSTEEPKNTTTSNAQSSNKNTKADSTTTKTKTLPKTGLEQYGFIAIGVMAIIAIVSYVLYKKIAKIVK